MSVSYWQRRRAQRLDADYVVVGAGIVGAYAAMCLAETGADVVLTDARHPAAGASGRNAGFLLSGLVAYYHDAIAQYGHATARAAWQLSIETRERAFALAEQFGVEHARCGSLLLAVRDEEAQALEQAARAMQADGFAAEFTPRDPLGRGFVAALHKPDDGVIDPVALVHALVAHGGAHGVFDNEVWALEAHAGGVLVRGARYEIHARGALLALNAYAPLLVPELWAVVRPVRAQMFVSAPLPERILDTAGYANDGYEYFRQSADGRFLMGGGRRRFKAEEVGWEDRTTPQVQAVLADFLQRYFPEVAHAPVEQRWSGTMGFTPDGLPVVGRVPNIPNAVFAVGFNGHGMGLGLKTAERAVAHLLHNAPLEWLDVNRLSGTTPTKAQGASA